MRIRFAPEALPLEVTPVENLFILEYMPGADGTQLRVYLYGLMLCRYPSFTQESICEALALSEQEVLQAYAHWQQEGLVRILCSDPLEVEYIAPSERRAGPMLLPGKYGTLIQAAQSLLAPRTLRTNELRRLYDWVDVFGLSEEAVLELISHCIARKGQRVSVNYIDSVARAWADDGIHSAAEAKARGEAYEELTGGAQAILGRWRVSRKPTQDELDLYRKWTEEWGFTREAILAACPTLTKAERPSFRYLDGALSGLRGEGAQGAEEIGRRLQDEEAAMEFARELFGCMGAGRGARPLERAQIQEFLQAGMQKEALLFAAAQAAGKERPYGYFKKLASSFAEKGALTLEEAEKAHAAAEQRGYERGKKPPKSMNYPQRDVKKEDIAHIFINLDEVQ